MPGTSDGKRMGVLQDWANDMNLGLKSRLKVAIRVLTAWRNLAWFKCCWRYSCRQKRGFYLLLTKSIAALSLFVFFFFFGWFLGYIGNFPFLAVED